MTIDNKIKEEKLQYNINREAAKISVLSSCKIDKYEHLTRDEMLLSDQRRVIEQATFTWSSLGKAFEKETKMIEQQWGKQTEAIEKHGKQLVKSNGLTEKEEKKYTTW